MKVTCQSCQAKYSIADEKVRGKVAKIRCKKCGTTIIVNGTDNPSALPSEHPPTSGPVADYTQQGPSDEQWTVLVADGDQRNLTAAQIAELYASGGIVYETPVWKDGMPEWLPIAQVDALRSVLDHGPRPTMTEHATAASVAEAAAPVPIAAAAPAAKQPTVAFPAAARRPGRGGSTDLFGAQAQDDVVSSASPTPALHASSDDRLTGARNENSVLFSLSALTAGGTVNQPATAPAPNESTMKADLRMLMGTTDNGRPAAAKSKLDDIMNLSGGGVYSPGLMAAPALPSAPVDVGPADTDLPSIADYPKPKSRMLTFGIIGGLALVGVAAIALMSSSSDETSKAAAAASAAAAAAAAPAEPETAKAEPSPAEPTAPTALAPGQAAPKADQDKAEKKAAAKADKAEKTEKLEKVASNPAPGPALTPVPAQTAATPAPEKTAAPAPAGGGGGSGSFDRAGALSALSAAATAAQSCKKPDGPTGTGRVAVTFTNDGSATTANIEGPPFAGTPVGGCIAARFRGTHVPPFGGAAVTVRKTFNIN